MSEVKKVDYGTICWSCGSNLMEDKGNYVQCRSCGATRKETPKIGHSALEDTTTLIKHGTSFVSRSRTPRVIKRRSSEEE